MENNNNRDIDDLKSFLPKLTDILDQAVDLYTTIPENNPYKKNLKDAMLPLDAKKIIMNNQIQELEFKNRNLDAPENFTENLPVLQTRLSELDNSIDALELAKKDIDDKQLLAKIDEDIFKMKSKQSQINELGLLQEMNNRPVYTPDLKTLQAEIDEEENKKIPSTDKNISENNQDKKKTVPTTVDYNSKNKEDDKLFDDFKNSFIPTTSNQSNDVKPDVLYTTSTDNNNTIPILTYESIPEDNENKQALDQINSDEKNVADKFKEKYNRDINTIGSVSNKLLVNVMNKNAS